LTCHISPLSRIVTQFTLLYYFTLSNTIDNFTCERESAGAQWVNTSIMSNCEQFGLCSTAHFPACNRSLGSVTQYCTSSVSSLWYWYCHYFIMDISHLGWCKSFGQEINTSSFECSNSKSALALARPNWQNYNNDFSLQFCGNVLHVYVLQGIKTWNSQKNSPWSEKVIIILYYM
jgi:hypothetical protein